MTEPVALVAGTPQRGDSPRAVQACNDWLRLGPGRSLPGLLAGYREIPGNTAPSVSLHTLEAWSKRFGWATRAPTYDRAEEAAKQAALDAERAAVAEQRRQVLATGFASDLARVQALNRLAELLEEQIYEDADRRKHRVWLRDVKQIGSGEFAQKVELERFNGALIEQFRGTLDDLAKETGGRVQKIAPTTPDGTAPYQPGLTLEDLSDLSDAELDALITQTPVPAAERADRGGPGGAR
jgi:hypothetical protein